mgnify:CR=1 FL=1
MSEPVAASEGHRRETGCPATVVRGARAWFDDSVSDDRPEGWALLSWTPTERLPDGDWTFVGSGLSAQIARGMAQAWTRGRARFCDPLNLEPNGDGLFVVSAGIGAHARLALARSAGWRRRWVLTARPEGAAARGLQARVVEVPDPGRDEGRWTVTALMMHAADALVDRASDPWTPPPLPVATSDRPRMLIHAGDPGASRLARLCAWQWMERDRQPRPMTEDALNAAHGPLQTIGPDDIVWWVGRDGPTRPLAERALGARLRRLDGEDDASGWLAAWRIIHATPARGPLIEDGALYAYEG